jgi:hypothetical protein
MITYLHGGVRARLINSLAQCARGGGQMLLQRAEHIRCRGVRTHAQGLAHAATQHHKAGRHSRCAAARHFLHAEALRLQLAQLKQRVVTAVRLSGSRRTTDQSSAHAARATGAASNGLQRCDCCSYLAVAINEIFSRKAVDKRLHALLIAVLDRHVQRQRGGGRGHRSAHNVALENMSKRVGLRRVGVGGQKRHAGRRRCMPIFDALLGVLVGS